MLADVPAGARHESDNLRALTATRLELALPLVQFNISRARATGDLRYLGYAEAILSPWMTRSPVATPVLILHATILQSRHQFVAALSELDQALRARPDDAQAWLTRATILRVLGRYEEAMESCSHLQGTADPVVSDLCIQGLRGLTGQLKSAYAGLQVQSQQSLPPAVRAWRYSELGEMAARLGDNASAEHWFREGLAIAPEDFYLRAACADVLLRQGRAAQALQLLAAYDSMEPLLLRLAIAHRMLGDAYASTAAAQLAQAFDIEQRRGDAVHRREQARFLLDVMSQPTAALEAALENWQVQREPDDILILLRAARAAHQPQAETLALQFVRQHRLEDVRLTTLLSGSP